MTEPATPSWLRRLIAVWLALALGDQPSDLGIRHSVAAMLAVPAGADLHGG